MSEIKTVIDVDAVPGSCCERVEGDKIVMYGVIEDENGISMNEGNRLGERPLKGSEFDKDSAAYTDAMERIYQHYVASGIKPSF